MQMRLPTPTLNPKIEAQAHRFASGVSVSPPWKHSERKSNDFSLAGVFGAEKNWGVGILAQVFPRPETGTNFPAEQLDTLISRHPERVYEKRPRRALG